jgi:hypothetical protein
MKFLKFILILVPFITPINLFAQTEAQIFALDTLPARPTAYQIEFKLGETLTPNAKLAFIFPDAFHLEQVIMADSDTIDGGFSTSVENDTIWVQRTGRGQSIQRESNVDIRLASIFNPGKMNANYVFQIGIIQQNQHKFTSVKTLVKKRELVRRD